MRACFARVLGLAWLAGALACDPDAALLGGARHFDEIAIDAARERIASEHARLLQVRVPDSGDPRVAGAEVLAPDAPLPGPGPGDGRLLLVVAHDDREARRFAARLARAGFERISVVLGGLQPWRERRAAPLADRAR